jgi:hypothetical protein
VASGHYRRLSFSLNSIHELGDARVLRKIEQGDACAESQAFATPGEVTSERANAGLSRIGGVREMRAGLAIMIAIAVLTSTAMTERRGFMPMVVSKRKAASYRRALALC